MRLTFFKTEKPRRFNHIPIYYDESKERLEQMEKDAQVLVGKSDGGFSGESIRYKFSRNRNRTPNDFARSESRKSTFRLLGIIAVLLLIGYLILRSGMGFFNLFLGE